MITIITLCMFKVVPYSNSSIRLRKAINIREEYT